MRPWPNAEFWRLWGCALALSLVAAAVFLGGPAHAETVRASFYGAESGRITASGAPFRPMGLTAASRTLPFGTRVMACLDRCTIVTVTDRGPFVAGRQMDFSRGAARAIGLEARGVANVTIRILGRAHRRVHRV